MRSLKQSIIIEMNVRVSLRHAPAIPAFEACKRWQSAHQEYHRIYFARCGSSMPCLEPPLKGIKILDLSQLLPGPYATQVLADMGAEVIKIESPAGDGTRHYPPLAKDGNSVMFHALNRGKRSVVLDLKNSEEDIRVLIKSLQKADVVVESFRPGVFERLLGIEKTEKLLEMFPNLIICRISGYGQTGPAALKPGHDLDYCARSGILSIMESPQVLPVQVADLCGGAWPAATQIVAALYRRSTSRNSKQGCVIDVSLTDGAYAMTVLPQSRQAFSGKDDATGGRDMLGGGIPGYNVYQTRDGRIALGALEPKFWKEFCKAMELDEFTAMEGVSTGSTGQRIRSRLQGILMGFTTDEILSRCKDKDIPVEKISSLEEASRDEQIASRNMTIAVEIDGKEIAFVRTPLSLPGAKPSESRGPALGEHNELFQK